jgi:hypothetical protein
VQLKIMSKRRELLDISSVDLYNPTALLISILSECLLDHERV